MKNKQSKILLIYLLIPGIIGVIGLIVGSFFDLEISRAIARPYSNIGKISESFGAILGYGLSPLAGTLIFIGTKNNQNKKIKVFRYFLICISIILPAYILGNEMNGADHSQFNIKIPTYLCFIISTFYCIVVSVFASYIFKEKESKKVLIAGAIIACVLVSELILQNVIKIFSGRPRFRYLYYVNDYDLFKNWWQFDFLANGFPKDFFKSLPSGHVLTTFATLSLISILPVFHKQLDCKTSLFLYLSLYLYAMTISVTRIIGGAHFLSDVSIGMILISLILSVYFKIFNFIQFVN